MNAAKHTFISVVREGIAGGLTNVDTFAPTTPGRAAFQARITLQGKTSAPEVSVDVLVHGPGDVVGFDPRQIIRTEPQPLTQDFEPNFFAAVEIDRPDLPWLFTPARETPHVDNPTEPSTASARLRPWMVLVVVRQQPGIAITMPDGALLPVLVVEGPALVADELPDLADSWAWAHAQTVGDSTVVADVLAKEPAGNLSRLLCPRKLEPASSFFACVVPAFRLGVAAGLGETITDESKLEPAWTQTDTAVRLPVYFHWEFRTGPNGDFEALASLLEPRSLTFEAATFPLDIARTGDARLPDDVPPIRFDGAVSTGPSPPFDNTAYQSALAGIVSQPVPVLDETAPDPLVAPPLYGRWHAAQESVGLEATWLADLNLDPRRRIAAGLGTQIVQEQQDQLIEAAWSQFGQIEKVNNMLRRAQLAREAGMRGFAKTVDLFRNDDPALAFVGPVLRRVFDPSGPSAVSNGGGTMHALLGTSRVAPGLASAAYRKLTRPRGRLGARVGGARCFEAVSIVSLLNDGSFQVVPPKVAADAGYVDGHTIPAGSPPAEHVLEDPGQALPPPTSATTLRDPFVDAANFQAAVNLFANFRGGEDSPGPDPVPDPTARPTLNIIGEHAPAIAAIVPERAIPRRVVSRMTLAGAPLDGDLPRDVPAGPAADQSFRPRIGC